jgi:hypothetical protein
MTSAPNMHDNKYVCASATPLTEGHLFMHENAYEDMRSTNHMLPIETVIPSPVA